MATTAKDQTSIGDPHQAALMRGTPVKFREQEPDRKRTLSAQLIRQAALSGVPVEVENAIVVGSLDLRYQNVPAPISLLGCVFRDGVDLSYTTFQQSLRLSRCVFWKHASFDSVVAKNDVWLNRTRFIVRSVMFADIQVDGVFFARGARFTRGAEVELSRAKFKAAVFLDACSFGGSAFFEDAVFAARTDMTRSSFKRGAQFTGCACHGIATFERAQFGPSAAIFNGAMFASDLLFRFARFEGSAHFRRTEVRGDAVFSEAQFPSTNGLDFQGSIMSGVTTFDGVRARGAADFRSARFNGGFAMRNAEFKSNVTFRGVHCGADLAAASAKFGSTAEFYGVTVRGDVVLQYSAFTARSVEHLFQGMDIDGTVYLDSSRIRGVASFIGIRIGGQLSLNDTVFEDVADFFEAKIARGVFLKRTEFGGDVLFNGVVSESGVWSHGTIYRKNASFESSRFQRLNFGPELTTEAPIGEPEFHGPCSFRFTHVVEWASFRNCVFQGKASFDPVRVTGPVEFDECVFAADAAFTAGHFGSRATFRSRFGGPTTFEGCTFGGTTKFSSPDAADRTFESVSFEHAVFEADARFEEARFGWKNNFRGCRFHALLFAPSGKVGGRDQFQGQLDLRGCTFTRIQVDPQSLIYNSAHEPRIDPDDREPYVELEAAFRRAGNDSKAEQVYLSRRRIERKRKWRAHQPAWLLDIIYARLARYGVRPYRLAALSAALLVIGTAFFTIPATVVPTDPKVIVQPNHRLGVGEALGVSVHYFLPVQVPLGARWKPADAPVPIQPGRPASSAGLWVSPSAFATFGLTLAGWILVPLGIGALAGILRRAAP